MDQRHVFREAAREQGLPDDLIDRWLQHSRPRTELTRDGDGPIAGRFGGRPALPEDVAWPDGQVHLVTVDLAALPAGSHDLGLPADGTLILFSEMDMCPDESTLLHIPAGTAVQDRTDHDHHVFPPFPLHARTGWSVPQDPGLDLPDDVEEAFTEATDALSTDDDTLFTIGGHGDVATSGVGHPVQSPATETLIAQLFLPSSLVDDAFGGADWWHLSAVLDTPDLPARRFHLTRFIPDWLG
ncbi:YwqG family protein [Catenuloplanes japonicus]|uniref:DUF1963 domain-containing protein n=1 Tax=Catenuloplanes japonicus TaxID=33876 RepID=UPI00068BC8BE|nr:DUF1963 domain-containing protein [Catenuloplanes japonicus]